MMWSMIASETGLLELGLGGNACISALGLVLGAEDHGALVAGLHDFQHVIELLGRERPNEPLGSHQQPQPVLKAEFIE